MAQDATTDAGQPAEEPKFSMTAAMRAIEGTMLDSDGPYAEQQSPTQEPEEPEPTQTEDPQPQPTEEQETPGESPANLDFASLSLEERVRAARELSDAELLDLVNGNLRQNDYTKKTQTLREKEREVEAMRAQLEARLANPVPQQQVQQEPFAPEPQAEVYPHQFDRNDPASVNQFDQWMRQNHGRHATEADVADLVAARRVEPVERRLEELTQQQRQAQQAQAEQQVAQAATTLAQQYPEIIGDPEVQQRLDAVLTRMDPSQITADTVISVFHGTFHDRVDEVREMRAAQGQQSTEQERRQRAAEAQPPPSGPVPPTPPPEPKNFDEMRELMLNSPEIIGAVEDTLTEDSDVYTQHLP